MTDGVSVVDRGQGNTGTKRPFRALLVDYGGVLTTSIGVSFGSFCVDNRVSPERLKDVLGAAYVSSSSARLAPTSAGDLTDLLSEVETGRLDPAEFDRRLAEALSLGLPEPIEPAGLTARLLAKLGPDERMRAAVHLARERGLATGLISNTWGHALPEDVDGMFAAMVLSGKE